MEGQNAGKTQDTGLRTQGNEMQDWTQDAGIVSDCRFQVSDKLKLETI